MEGKRLLLTGHTAEGDIYEDETGNTYFYSGDSEEDYERFLEDEKDR